MNIALRIILEKAFEYRKAREERDEALDLIYTKLLILPIQRSWRSKHSKALI